MRAHDAHKLKSRPTTALHLLNKCASFVLGGGAILVLHAVGVIESSSWPTFFVESPQIKPLKFLQKGEDFTMFYIVSSVSLFCLLIFVSLSLVSLSLLYKCHLLIKCFIISPFFRSITCAFVSFPSRLPHMAPFFNLLLSLLIFFFILNLPLPVRFLSHFLICVFSILCLFYFL